MATSPRPGEPAPAFELKAAGGKTVRLADFKGKTLVLYFYPKDETPGCTAEACGFRDAYQDFTDAGAEVVGVSADSVASHEAFAAHHKLPFTLVSDSDGAVRGLYGVKPTLGIMPGRVTFVIDREGVVQHSFSSQIRFAAHVREALETVRKLEATRRPG